MEGDDNDDYDLVRMEHIEGESVEPEIEDFGQWERGLHKFSFDEGPQDDAPHLQQIASAPEPEIAPPPVPVPSVVPIPNNVAVRGVNPEKAMNMDEAWPPAKPVPSEMQAQAPPKKKAYPRKKVASKAPASAEQRPVNIDKMLSQLAKSVTKVTQSMGNPLANQEGSVYAAVTGQRVDKETLISTGLEEDEDTNSCRTFYRTKYYPIMPRGISGTLCGNNEALAYLESDDLGNFKIMGNPEKQDDVPLYAKVDYKSGGVEIGWYDLPPKKTEFIVTYEFVAGVKALKQEAKPEPCFSRHLWYVISKDGVVITHLMTAKKDIDEACRTLQNTPNSAFQGSLPNKVEYGGHVHFISSAAKLPIP